jgi:hypothetical protein
VLYNDGDFQVVPFDMVNFLNHMLNTRDGLRKADVLALRKELGPLAWDECYTYAPALPVGTQGPRKPSKGKLIPYLSIIGQMVAPVKIAQAVELA